jgi:hypothetical protein
MHKSDLQPCVLKEQIATFPLSTRQPHHGKSVALPAKGQSVADSMTMKECFTKCLLYSLKNSQITIVCKPIVR